MISIFKERSIISIFSLLVIAGLVHIHLFIQPATIVIIKDNGLLSFVFQSYLQSIPKNLVPFLYFVIIITQAIPLNWFLNETKMFGVNGFTVAFSYVLLTGFLPEWSALTPALIANYFVLWIFICLSKIYNNANPRTALFNIGLIIGAASICYHPTSMLIVIVLFALAIVRPFILSEWLVLILGIILPMYIFASLFYLNDRLPDFIQNLPIIKLNIPIQKPDYWFAAKIVWMIILLIIGLQYWSANNSRMLIQIRKNWTIMLVMVLLSLSIPFIFKNAGMVSAYITLVPLASFVGHAFLCPKKMWLPNFLFIISCILIVQNNLLLLSKG